MYNACHCNCSSGFANHFTKNLQVSFEDVKLVASQLGFKGKKGLVVEPRVTQKEDEEEDEVVMIEDEESSSGDGHVVEVEEAMAVQGDEVEQYNGQSSREGNFVEQVKSRGRQEARKSPPGKLPKASNGEQAELQSALEDRGELMAEPRGRKEDQEALVGDMSCMLENIAREMLRASSGKQANADNNQDEENSGRACLGFEETITVQGNEVGQQSSRIQRLDEVPHREVEFHDALEGDARVRATSTPLAGSKSPTFPSENDASKISREVPIEQMDENGNQEGDANREERASFSASILREDNQGGFVEESAVGEQEMDIDHSLMEKTRETPIVLGSGDQGLRRSSSASPMVSKSASPMTNPLKGNARRRSQHNGDKELRKCLEDQLKSGRKGDKQPGLKGAKKQKMKHQKVSQEKSKPSYQVTSINTVDSLRIALKRSMTDEENVPLAMQGGAQSSGAVAKTPKKCRKCDKAIRGQSNLCGNCKAIEETQEKMNMKNKEIEEAKRKMKSKQDGSAEVTDETEATRRRQSVATDIGREKQVAMKLGACHNCAGCKTKKGCKEIFKGKKAQKQGGSVNVANEAGNLTRCRRSQSEAGRNAGRAGRGGEMRKVAGNVASGEGGQEDEGRVKENKRARTDKRVSFNEVVKVVEVQGGGRKRPVRSRAGKEEGFYSKYFSEEPELEEDFRCKNCKTRFLSKGKLRR